MNIIKQLFKENLIQNTKNYFVLSEDSDDSNQHQVNDSYDFQWKLVNETKERDTAWSFQKKWYLELYGFKTEENLAKFLQTKKVILDAGCGLGYKAAWFAELAPNSCIIGIDYSDGALYASEHFKDIENLVFVKGDIANTGFNNSVIDYISCDQVLQHTESPKKTLIEFNRIMNNQGELAVYVYRKKALPRELIDTYFRTETKKISIEQKVKMSEQLTVLGKRLAALNVEIDVPEIPLLGIKGGKQDIQRFIYWDFLKCFWNDELGHDISVSTNFDWYSPSNAARYSKSEFLKMLLDTKFKSPSFFREEEACYTAIVKKS